MTYNQDRVYPNGTRQYRKDGIPNIEFEAKLTQDLINWCCDRPVAYLGAGPHNIKEYMGWIFTICEDIDIEFPSLNDVLNTQYDNKGYYDFMAA